MSEIEQKANKGVNAKCINQGSAKLDSCLDEKTEYFWQLMFVVSLSSKWSNDVSCR